VSVVIKRNKLNILHSRKSPYNMARATNATPINEKPAVVLTPAPGVLVAPAAAVEVELVTPPADFVGTMVAEVDGPDDEVMLPPTEVVELVPALADATVDDETTTEVTDVPVVPAADVVVADAEEEEVPDGAEVAAAPVPVEVRTALRRDPTLPGATHVPATLLVMS